MIDLPLWIEEIALILFALIALARLILGGFVVPAGGGHAKFLGAGLITSGIVALNTALQSLFISALPQEVISSVVTLANLLAMVLNVLTMVFFFLYARSHYHTKTGWIALFIAVPFLSAFTSFFVKAILGMYMKTTDKMTIALHDYFSDRYSEFMFYAGSFCAGLVSLIAAVAITVIFFRNRKKEIVLPALYIFFVLNAVRVFAVIVMNMWVFVVDGPISLLSILEAIVSSSVFLALPIYVLVRFRKLKQLSVEG